jgi:hypothetical protein
MVVSIKFFQILLYMNIICLLSVRPCILTYNFYKNIQLNSQYDVFIVIDDNNYNIPEYDGVVKIIKINNKECEDNGYKSCVAWLDNKACSRDKALYYFNKENIPFDFIWFVEEDVFIPSINTIINIDNKYKFGDLLAPSHNIIHAKRTNWHWPHINRQIKINPPYGSSMICAIRCSKQMLNSIQRYAQEHNNLFMDEALFNTLAIHNNLIVCPIPELRTIIYRKQWKLKEILISNLYHPIKNIKHQYFFREKLIKDSANKTN